MQCVFSSSFAGIAAQVLSADISSSDRSQVLQTAVPSKEDVPQKTEALREPALLLPSNAGVGVQRHDLHARQVHEGAGLRDPTGPVRRFPRRCLRSVLSAQPAGLQDRVLGSLKKRSLYDVMRALCGRGA